LLQKTQTFSPKAGGFSPKTQEFLAKTQDFGNYRNLTCRKTVGKSVKKIPTLEAPECVE